MAEMKPCKCRCGIAPLEQLAHTAGRTVWLHPISECFMSGMYILSDKNLQAWNTLMSDTPALRYVRMGLEMAAKWHDAEEACADLLRSTCRTEYGAEPHRRTAEMHRRAGKHLRAIPDADIEKEISRE